MASPKTPHETDKLVGARVRTRRLQIGMSQQKLGAAIGVTFQQIQKYEKGTNRIGASRLNQIAGTLEVPVSYFFEGVEQDAAALKAEGIDSIASLDLRFARDFSQLNPEQQRSIKTIVAHIREASGLTAEAVR